MEYLYIIGGVVVLIINVIGSILMANAAREKGYDSNAHVFAACFFLGIVGYLYAICLPDMHQQDIIAEIQEEIKKIKTDTKTLVEGESDRRYDAYWAEHQDEKNALEAELNSVNDQINRANNALNARITSLTELSKTTSDKSEKEKIENQITYIRTEGQKRLKPLQDKAEAIKKELYRDR